MERKDTEFIEKNRSFDANNECMTSEERRHFCHLFIQNTFIPEMVDGVKAGEVPYSELLNTQGWKFYLNMSYGDDFVFDWDNFEANAFSVDENIVIITYKYSMPQAKGEHIFTGVIVNKATNAADLYFLECYNPEEWRFGCSTRNEYIEHERVETPNLGEFTDWVLGQRVYVA